MNDVLNQLRTEWVHTALALLVIGVGGVGTVMWFFYRRDVKRGDTEMAKALADIEEHSDKLGSHDRQIRDTRTAIAECRTKCGLDSYPYTE